jgi:Leucine Rich repeat
MGRRETDAASEFDVMPVSDVMQRMCCPADSESTGPRPNAGTDDIFARETVSKRVLSYYSPALATTVPRKFGFARKGLIPMKKTFGLSAGTRWLPCGRFPTLVMLLVAAVGCGKIPTWSELMGQQPAPPPPTRSVAPTAPVPVEVPSAKPAAATPVASKPNAAEIIARFKALPSGQVNDATVLELTSLTEGLDAITEINTNSGSFTDAGMALLRKLPALKHLGLNGFGVTNTGMQSLAQVVSLESLTLQGTQVSGDGIAKLTSLPHLKTLELGMSTTNPDVVAAIGRMPALETIVYTYGMNDASLDVLCECRTLKVLQLNGSSGITDDGLKSLRKLDSVEELHLSGSRVTGTGLGQVFKQGGLKNLRVLNLNMAPLNEQGAKAINLLKSLESLSISDVPGMNDLGLVTLISGMRKLKYLNVSKCKGIYGQKGFAALRMADDIESIVAFDTNVNDLGLVQLKSRKNLKTLDLSFNTGCTLSGVQALKQALPNCEIRFAGQKY